MKFKAVIFDLDGTLLDTLQDLHLTMNRVLEKSGYPTISLETVKHLIGNGARDFMRLALPEHARDEENIDKNLLLYHKLYDECGQQNTKPYDGIEKVLKILTKSNIKIGVLSNKPHLATVSVVEKFFFSYHFHSVIGQKDIFPPKPDTASALYMANLLGVKPCETVFIGDGDTDAIVANNGGFYQLAVLWGYRSKEELKIAGAKNFVNSPDEILDLLKIS